MNLINILYILEFLLITLGFRYIIQPTDNLTGIMITPRELWTVPYLFGWCALVFYIGPLIVIPWTFYSIFTLCKVGDKVCRQKTELIQSNKWYQMKKKSQYLI